MLTIKIEREQWYSNEKEFYSSFFISYSQILSTASLKQHIESNKVSGVNTSFSNVLLESRLPNVFSRKSAPISHKTMVINNG